MNQDIFPRPAVTLRDCQEVRVCQKKKGLSEEMGVLLGERMIKVQRLCQGVLSLLRLDKCYLSRVTPKAHLDNNCDRN